MSAIIDIFARETLDSRDTPTVEVALMLEDGIKGGAANLQGRAGAAGGLRRGDQFAGAG